MRPLSHISTYQIYCTFVRLSNVVTQAEGAVTLFSEIELPGSRLSANDHQSIRVRKPLETVACGILSRDLDVR